MNDSHSIRLKGDQAAAPTKIRVSDRDTVVLKPLQHACGAGASAAHVS
jgi:hypothetical protein